MAPLYSNELKAVVWADNYLNNPMSVLKENCLTVQNFSYDCVHRRNDADELFGSMEPVILEFKVRVNAPHHASSFYHGLTLETPSDFSILFNATFNSSGRLSSYDDGLVATGFVVQVEEEYHAGQDDSGKFEQMLLNVKMLLRSVVYLGKENHFTNTFVN